MRVTSRRRVEPLAAAFEYLPSRIVYLLGNVHVCTERPRFVGLHGYVWTQDGRSYDETPHVTFPVHQGHLSRSRRHTTVVVPPSRDKLSLYSAIHELGHVLEDRIGHDYPDMEPYTPYALAWKSERFAEAFCRWVFQESMAEYDESFFQNLAYP